MCDLPIDNLTKHEEDVMVGGTLKPVIVVVVDVASLFAWSYADRDQR